MGGVSLLKFLNYYVSFGCGFFLFGCFDQCFNVLCLSLLLIVGFKVLQYGHHLKGLAQTVSCFGGKSVGGGNGFSSNMYLGDDCDLKMELLKNAEQPAFDHLGETERIAKNENGNARTGDDDDAKEGAEFSDESHEKECYEEDEVVGVMVLRKMVKTERQRADDACNELEKERIAAASAAEETMAMILRLQKEKSLVEMQFKQFQRLAEEKQLHDQEVVQALRWIVMKHETERRLLEDYLRCVRKNLNICDIVDETEGDREYLSLFDSSMERSPGDALVSSRDIDLTPL